MKPRKKVVTVRSRGQAVMNNSELSSFFDAINDAKSKAAKRVCGTSYQNVSSFTIKSAKLSRKNDRFYASIVAKIQCKPPTSKKTTVTPKKPTAVRTPTSAAPTCAGNPRFERPFCDRSDETSPKSFSRFDKL